MDKDSIIEALKVVKFPGFSRDIVSFGLVREVEIDQGNALIGIEITTADDDVPKKIAADIKATLGSLEGIVDVKVRVEISRPQQQPNTGSGASPSNHPAMQKVKYAIAVASGKGGVGKSTVTVNLACALQQLLQAQGKPGVGICLLYTSPSPRDS